MDAAGLGLRIRELRKSVPKRTTEEFGALIGVTGGAVRNWEANGKISPENLVLIAEKCGVSLEWLSTGKGDMPKLPDQLGLTKRDNLTLSTQMFSVNNHSSVGALLDVLATADNGRGEAVVYPSLVVERIARPFVLRDREDAYGLFISGNTMSPALRYGDTAWVDPVLPYAPDMEIVLYRAGAEDKDEKPIFIGTLIGFSDSEWTVEVLKPETRRFVVKRAEWPKCHRIVGKTARR